MITLRRTALALASAALLVATLAPAQAAQDPPFSVLFAPPAQQQVHRKVDSKNPNTQAVTPPVAFKAQISVPFLVGTHSLGPAPFAGRYTEFHPDLSRADSGRPDATRRDPAAPFRLDTSRPDTSKPAPATQSNPTVAQREHNGLVSRLIHVLTFGKL